VRSRVPDHMVPAAFVILDALPLTPNGKLDRAALPTPVWTTGGSRAPRAPQEQLLTELFGEVLGLAVVGVGDDFFDLGGHSLLATRLIARIRATFDVELELRVLFEHSTPAALAQQLPGAGQARLALTRQVRPDRVALSFAQRRLWFLHQMEGPSATYNICLALRLSGVVNREALRAALGDVVARHESLRTVFRHHDGVAYQQVLDPEAACPALGITTTTEVELPALLTAAARYAFDLAGEPPLRAQLFVLGLQEQVLLIVVHHIAGDGWSLRPLARDLATAYAAHCHGQQPDWAPLPVQYVDYTLWQHQLLGDHADPDSLFAAQVAYWTQALAGLPEQLALPTDRPRPPVASYRGDYLPVHLDATLHQQLRDLARRSGASLFMVLQAALATLLTKLGAGEDIPIGSAIAGRTDHALDDLVGFFVNTLVLRTDTSGNPTFTQLLAQVRDTALAAYAHQDVPFEYLVEVLNPTRSLAHHPLFQVMFGLQNTPPADFDLPDLEVQTLPVPIGTAKFDLSVHLWEHHTTHGNPDGLHGIIEYATDLFDQPTIETIVTRWVRLLETVATDPHRPISQIDLLTTDERHQLLIDCNATTAPTPASCLPVLFETQVAATPDAPAVICGNTTLTYRQLNTRANQLAHTLIAQGVSPECAVAVLVQRSINLAVAILAIVKTGGLYVPLDTRYPLARMQLILADTGAAVLITDHTHHAHPVTHHTAVITVNPADQPTTHQDPGNPPLTSDPQQLAYVMYTSGSTGQPKGIAITHQDIIDLASDPCWRHNAHQRVLLHSPAAFDASTYELWIPLLSGGQIIIAPPDDLDPTTLHQLITQHHITG
ncbi:MAG: AMP-binding protein, partial [Pseudonocardiales bacterium]|nr:AMP-binding protein [Pseudonocardiales bacterium]